MTIWRGMRSAMAAGCALGALTGVGTASAQLMPRAAGVIVGIAPNATVADRAEVRTALEGERIERLGRTDLFLVSRVTPTSVGAAARDVAGLPQVDTVSLDLPVHADGMPNDEYWPFQWGPQLIGLPAALDLATSRQPVNVAVVDTGIDLAHPDLAAHLWTNPGEIPADGIDNDHNGYIDDVHGWDFANEDADPSDTSDHGTHVAGIIAAGTDNGIGIAGIAPGARLMALKFMVPVGGRETGTTADAVRALDYARLNGAQVINNSWSSSATDLATDPVCQAITAALGANIVVVNAAGNDATDLDSHVSPPFLAPAQCPGPEITVAATTSGDFLWSPVSLGNPGSNYGSASVDLGAPGQTIRSTVHLGYASNTGTSMAAPHVAGAAALLLGEMPALSPVAVRGFIMNGGVSLPGLTGRTVSGRRLSLPGALALATGAGSDVTAPSAPLLSVPAQDEIVPVARPSFRWTASIDQSAVSYEVAIDETVIARAVAGTSTVASDPLPDGPHTWFVRAIDAAGNTSRSAIGRFRVDTAVRSPDAIAPISRSAPARALSAGLPGGRRVTRTRAIRLDVALPDGAATLRLAESASGLRSAPTRAASTTTTFTLSAARSRADRRTIHVAAYDPAGAVLGTVTVPVTLDQAAPIATARVGWMGGHTVVVVTARDENGPVRYQVVGTRSWTPFRGTVRLTDAARAISSGIRVRDEAGNTTRIIMPG